MTPQTLEGVVASGTGGVWRVMTDDGGEHEAVMRGRLKKVDSGRRSDGSMRRDTVAASAATLKLAVGDRVRVELVPLPGGDYRVPQVRPA